MERVFAAFRVLHETIEEPLATPLDPANSGIRKPFQPTGRGFVSAWQCVGHTISIQSTTEVTGQGKNRIKSGPSPERLRHSASIFRRQESLRPVVPALNPNSALDLDQSAARDVGEVSTPTATWVENEFLFQNGTVCRSPEQREPCLQAGRGSLIAESESSPP